MTASSLRSTALVTGASAGIGTALAWEFARHGFDLVLVARREDRLHALADELQRAHGVRAHRLAADLASPDTPAWVHAQTARIGVEIDALINNAGFGIPGPLSQCEWSRQRDCLEVMTAAPAHLAYLFTPAMAARGRGWVLNVASLAALLPPHAGGTLYYPVKAFVLKLSLALHEELRPSGVHVTALCPGFTETEFQQAAGGTVESVRPPAFMWMAPETVARAGFRAVMRGDRCCIPGLVNKTIAGLFKLMPDALGRRLMRGES